MPFFNHEKILFIHVPRTGGRTIEYLFQRWNYPNNKGNVDLETSWENFFIKKLRPIPISRQHYTWNEIKEHFPEYIEKAVRLFTVIRHPADRFLSEYYYLQKQIMNPKLPAFSDNAKRYNFEQRDCRNLADINVFIPWIKEKVKKNPYYLDGHFRSLRDFLGNPATPPASMEIHQFEHLPELVSKLQSQCKHVIQESTPRKDGYAKPNDVFISRENWKLLVDWYDADFDLFPCYARDQLRFSGIQIQTNGPDKTILKR